MLPPLATELTESLVGEMVEDQVADDDWVVRIAGERGEVMAKPAMRLRQVGRGRAEVKARDVRPARGETLPQLAGARAQFQDALAGMEQGRQRPFEPTVIAHQAVDDAQVAATVPGIGMVGRKRIEQLGVQPAR